jgi:hypothetical protein
MRMNYKSNILPLHCKYIRKGTAYKSLHHYILLDHIDKHKFRCLH